MTKRKREIVGLASGVRHSDEKANQKVTTEKLLKEMTENQVSLQKVQVGLAERFDSLTKQIMALLGLFETAAKNIASNPENKATTSDKEFLDKIDKILEQNKILARGLTMMEERFREKIGVESNSSSITPTRAMTQELRENKDTRNAYSDSEQVKYEPSINRPLPKF